MRILFISFFLFSAFAVNAQNPLVGNWVGKYSLDYDDETFAHFPLPYCLTFTEDSLIVHYFEDFRSASHDTERLHYKLKKNFIEFHQDEDTFQILLVGINPDTLAFFGESFDEGIMVFSKIKTEPQSITPALNLKNRSFILKDKANKTLDTFEFFPGNIMLSYHSLNNWNLDNYQIIRFGNAQFLDLRSDDHSLLKVLSNKKNEITLLNQLNDSDTLTLTELTRKKKSSYTKTKWKFLSPEKPCNSVIVGFNDSSLIATADKKDVLSTYYISYNENFLLALRENYQTSRNKEGILPSIQFNFYRCKKISADELHLYNQNRGISHDPFVCGKEFELRLVKTK